MKNVSKTTLVFNVLGILIIVNVLASFFPVRMDLTENKAFTLSGVTKKTVKSLDDLITIKVFLSENLPARLLPIKQKIKDTLGEYEKIAGGKLRITYTDPKNNQELISQAESLGIPQLRFSDVQNDKYSVSTGFLGMAILFGDRKEAIETVSENTNLEHDVTSAIKKLSEKNAAKIGITSGHGESDQTKVSYLRPLLEKDLSTTEVAISDKDDQSFIDESVSTLLLINPTQKFSDRALLTIDQFLMKGGSLVLLLDPINVSGNLQPSANATNIGELIQNYGIKVNNDLVLSADNEVANFSTGYTAFITPYPFWVRILAAGFNQSYSATSNIDTTVFPWVSSITTDKNRAGTATITELIKTSPRSFLQTGSINLDPSREVNPKEEDLKEFTVAALVSGKLGSAVRSSEEIKKTIRKGETLLEQGSKDARIIVFADSDFVTDYFIRRYNGNAALLLNTVESVSSDTSLSEIRNKGSNFKPLRELSDSMKALTKWSNIIGLPILISIVGLIRFLLRSR